MANFIKVNAHYGNEVRTIRINEEHIVSIDEDTVTMVTPPINKETSRPFRSITLINPI